MANEEVAASAGDSRHYGRFLHSLTSTKWKKF